MSKLTFLERLQQDKPLLTDGAGGTNLHLLGSPIDACFDELNLTHPEMIARLHDNFLQVGAELLKTNTFASNRYKLAKHGLEDQVVAINKAAVDIAQRVVSTNFREDVYIAGSVGPLGVRLRPLGRTTEEEAEAAFIEQIGALAEAGVDAILLETFSDRQEILVALRAAKTVAPDVPVIANTTYSSDDRTLLGDLPARIARDLHSAGADVIGVNCGGGPAQISRILQLIRQAVPDTLTAAVPNAGFPEAIDGRMMYPATPDYFGDYARTFQALGASMIGGCCGTTAEHIAAMRVALDDDSRPLPEVHFFEPSSEDQALVPERPTPLARKLAEGKFVVTVEMSPPRSFVPQKILTAAQLLEDSGADMVDVADSPTARMRMSPWAVCHFLQSRQGIETVLHFPTRGRNLLRIQGDLLAAHALGLRNLFVVMGDPTHVGDYPQAMDNYDVPPTGLIKLIKQQMNHGVDYAGNSIGQPASFTVGCALNMGALDLDREIKLLRKKMDSGADFALCQPCFNPAEVERFQRRYEELAGEPLKLPVLIGILPLFNARHAHFLHNEIPGIVIPEALVTRMERAGDDAAAEGVRIARELLLDIKDSVQGVYVMPAFGKYELAAEVIDVLGIPSQA